MSHYRALYNILFLCTGNSARSILAEAIMNRVGEDRFKAYSAGSHPKGEINPGTLRWLKAEGYDPSQFRSKSWDEFEADDAPVFDFIVTVCDDAAGEICPVWPGKPVCSHWGIPDPALAQGAEWETDRVFADAARMLGNRIRLFASLPIDKLDSLSLKHEMDLIGRNTGADQSA